MANRGLDRDSLGQHEDWHGNNAAMHCPVCGKLFIVSGFIGKGQRRCPKCQRSTAEITNERVTIEWPDAVDEVQIVTREDLEDKKRLDEFVNVVAEGGAIQRSSIDAKLPSAEKIAFIERDSKMAAVAALKKARAAYATHLTKMSGYKLSGDIPEVGYVAVASAWRGIHLSSKVVDKILLEFGPRSVFATTSEPKMKCLLANRSFRWVGEEWPSSDEPTQLLSLWIRGDKK